MQKISTIYLFISLFLITFTACEADIEPSDVDFGYDYFPMTPDRWIEYDVDSVMYSDFLTGGIDTLSYQVREEYSEPFEDIEGRDAITVKRYVRSDESTSWQNITPTVWYAVRDSQQVEWVAGSLRFIKLVFPIQANAKWAGNAYLNTDLDDLEDYENWQYTYNQVGESQMINSMSFDETTTVLQQDYEDLIYKSYSEEVYAKNVGLVYKEQWILRSDDSMGTDAWPHRAENGFLFTMKVTDYKQ